MATSWFWERFDSHQAVVLVQRERQFGHTSDHRILLTKAQILKLAKEIQEKDEGKL